MAFIADCYGPAAPFKGERRWRWQFLETPYPDGEADPPVWVALDGDSVVGQIALQPAAMSIDGVEAPAGWIVDVMIRPEHRGLGLAHRIHEAMIESGQTLVTLTMAPATRRVAERAGAVTLPPAYTMLRSRSLSGATLARVLRDPVERRAGLARLAGRAFMASRVGPGVLALAANAASAPGRGRRGGTGLEVSPAATPFGDEADALFRRCAATYEALFDRRAAFLNWRFGRAPDLDYRWLQARRDGGLAGLVVWRLPRAMELPFGVLTDFWAESHDGQAQDGLVEAATAAMQNQTEAVIAGASHPVQVAALRRHGFHVVRTHRPTIVTRDAVLRERLAGRPLWRFGKADHDWDQVTPTP
ncbi:MAG: family N-acetyltransferase [Caulobacteraceae bacterium]|nr:family N-acetyltransferase [Caulobacteraceae bacterium]